MTVVNVNPLYTPRELRAPAEGLRRQGHRHRRELRQRPAAGAREHAGRARDHHPDRRPAAGPEALARQLRHQEGEEDGARLAHRRRHRASATALARGAAAPFRPVEVTRDDIAFLQYTGGTTGVSKGAMLTHRNILANLEQTGVWISGSFKEGAEIVIAPLPMYHIFCLTSTLSFMKWGSLIVLITNPRDLPALRQGTAAVEVQRDDRRQHAVQRPPEHARIRPARLFRAEGGRSAAAPRCRSRWPSAGSR